MIDLANIQQKNLAWTRHNFPNAKPHQPLLGMVEEVGELSHAHLKMEQGIRGDREEHIAASRDAIGDILIFMLHYCNLRGWSLEDILIETAAHVHKRDWIKYPKTGVPPAPESRPEEDGKPSPRF